MYAKIEQQRLNYIKMNQQQSRSDLYSRLADAVHSCDTNAKVVGRNIILPSYTGNPRQMFEFYQDAMCIVRKFGSQIYSLHYV